VNQRVRVIVELHPGAAFTPSRDTTIEASYANQLQARVPVDELCALSNDLAVARVVPARGGVPDTGRP
jgi:hypothetical protein